MNDTLANDPLAELKDIHLPADVSWWPLAPGWWLLLALLAILITATVWFVAYHRKHNAWRKAALQELADIDRNITDANAAIEAMAALVRRSAITAGKTRGTEQHIAQLQGEAWQHYLQNTMPTEFARWIAVDRYQPQHTIDRQALAAAVQQWIRKHKS